LSAVFFKSHHKWGNTDVCHRIKLGSVKTSFKPFNKEKKNIDFDDGIKSAKILTHFCILAPKKRCHTSTALFHQFSENAYCTFKFPKTTTDYQTSY